MAHPQLRLHTTLLRLADWGSTLLNPVGRLVKAATTSTQTINSYDPMGRVNSQWQCYAPELWLLIFLPWPTTTTFNGDLGTSN